MIRSQIATLACLSSGYVFTGVSSCLFLPSPLRQSVHHRCLQNVFGPACFCVCAVFWYQSHLVVTLVVLERTESCFEVWRQTDLIHMAKTKVSRGVFEWGLGSALCREPAAPRAGTPVLLPLNTGSLQHQMWGGLEVSLLFRKAATPRQAGICPPLYARSIGTWIPLLNAISCISFYSGEDESSAGNYATPKGISFTPFTPRS